MKNDELEQIWQDIELNGLSGAETSYRMIWVDMLYRVYIGSSGIPSQRCVSMEIPESYSSEFDAFSAPQGFTFTLGEPNIKHDGFVACIIQSSSHDQNDVFSVVILDILHELSNQKNTDGYVYTLKQRIEKWRDFFKNPASKKLSENMVIGLWGELNLLYSLYNSGVTTIPDFWNGPIKASQDFQGHKIALEVKTTVSDSMDYVNISSEAQLDGTGHEALFLTVLRIERNDAAGITLPVLIEKISNELSEAHRKRFYVALLCLGYSDDDACLYNKGYTLKEQRNYQIRNDFPCLLRSDMPQGVYDVKYKLSLNNCVKYLVEWENMVATIKEYEYGQR